MSFFFGIHHCQDFHHNSESWWSVPQVRLYNVLCHTLSTIWDLGQLMFMVGGQGGVDTKKGRVSRFYISELIEQETRCQAGNLLLTDTVVYFGPSHFYFYSPIPY